jgi:hypothetical protein
MTLVRTSDVEKVLFEQSENGERNIIRSKRDCVWQLSSCKESKIWLAFCNGKIKVMTSGMLEQQVVCI